MSLKNEKTERYIAIRNLSEDTRHMLDLVAAVKKTNAQHLCEKYITQGVNRDNKQIKSWPKGVK